MAMESGDYTFKYAFGTKAKGGCAHYQDHQSDCVWILQRREGPERWQCQKSCLGLCRVPHEHRLLSDHFSANPALRFNIGLHLATSCLGDDHLEAVGLGAENTETSR